MSDKLNLIETTAKQGNLSTFSRIMGTSGTNEVFSSSGEFTVFAPTNEAFAKIPDAQMNELLNEEKQLKLKALLSYHILPGKRLAADLAALKTTSSVTGDPLTFTDKNGIRINGAAIQARNIDAVNGVVHTIDTVLSPPAKAVAASGTTGKSVL